MRILRSHLSESVKAPVKKKGPSLIDEIEKRVHGIYAYVVLGHFFVRKPFYTPLQNRVLGGYTVFSISVILSFINI